MDRFSPAKSFVTERSRLAQSKRGALVVPSDYNRLYDRESFVLLL